MQYLTKLVIIHIIISCLIGSKVYGDVESMGKGVVLVSSNGQLVQIIIGSTAEPSAEALLKAVGRLNTDHENYIELSISQGDKGLILDFLMAVNTSSISTLVISGVGINDDLSFISRFHDLDYLSLGLNINGVNFPEIESSKKEPVFLDFQNSPITAKGLNKVLKNNDVSGITMGKAFSLDEIFKLEKPMKPNSLKNITFGFNGTKEELSAARKHLVKIYPNTKLNLLY